MNMNILRNYCNEVVRLCKKERKSYPKFLEINSLLNKWMLKYVKKNFVKFPKSE